LNGVNAKPPKLVSLKRGNDVVCGLQSFEHRSPIEEPHTYKYGALHFLAV
jgi:hypothetical protein